MSTLAQRLAAKTERADNGCLRFTGAHNSRGYGCIGVNGKSELAHRVAYELHVGPIGDGLQIDHVAERGCRYKDCVEPSHLEPVTGTVNQRRSPRAVKAHCKHGHPRTPENLIVKDRGGNRVSRECRPCNRARLACNEFTARSMNRKPTADELVTWLRDDAEKLAAAAAGRDAA